MQVKVVDRLAANLAVVDDDSESVVQLQLLGDLLSSQHEMTQQLLVLIGCLRQLRDRLFRNHKEVHRSLGSDVVEGDALQSTNTLLYRSSRFMAYLT